MTIELAFEKFRGLVHIDSNKSHLTCADFRAILSVQLAVAAANVKKFSRQHEGGRGRVVARRRGKGGGGLAKIGGSERDLEEGAALFRVAASPAGTVLPEVCDSLLCGT